MWMLLLESDAIAGEPEYPGVQVSRFEPCQVCASSCVEKIKRSEMITKKVVFLIFPSFFKIQSFWEKTVTLIYVCRKFHNYRVSCPPIKHGNYHWNPRLLLDKQILRYSN